MIELDRSSGTPLYLQIKNQLRYLILSGTLAGGTQLPAERKLAASLGITRGTVTSAYQELVADGLAAAHVGRGTIVRQAHEVDDTPPQRLPLSWHAMFVHQPQQPWEPLLDELLRLATRPNVIPFTAGVPAPDLYPEQDFRRTVAAVLSQGDPNALGSCAAEGHHALRRMIAQHMASEGTQVQWEQVLVTTGAQQGLDLLVRALIEPGDVVVVEKPTYLGALRSFGAAGARLLGVPLDRNGLRLDLLEGILSRYHPKLIYTLPTFQNPSGSSQNLERRVGLLALAARYGLPIVEDDPYRPLYYEGAPAPTLKALDQRDSVIYLSTLSKTLFPGLRLGWIAAPLEVVEQLTYIKKRTDPYGNSLAQWATARFIEAGYLKSHLGRVRPAYRRRRDAMAEALAEHCPDLGFEVPAGGFNLWCRLPEGLRSRDLLAEASLRNVVFAPGELFFAERGGEGALRLNFSSLSEERIHKGISRLGEALAALRAQAAETPEPETSGQVLV
jgi:DNA-binding transcriptional MocR family regulator